MMEPTWSGMFYFFRGLMYAIMLAIIVMTKKAMHHIIFNLDYPAI